MVGDIIADSRATSPGIRRMERPPPSLTLRAQQPAPALPQFRYPFQGKACLPDPVGARYYYDAVGPFIFRKPQQLGHYLVALFKKVVSGEKARIHPDC